MSFIAIKFEKTPIAKNFEIAFANNKELLVTFLVYLKLGPKEMLHQVE